MTGFIGRHEELTTLQSVLKKTTASFVVIRGRRRIGKSRLIREFCQGKHFIYLSGIPPQKNTTAQSQRDHFALSLQEKLRIPLPRSDDWSHLFNILSFYTETGRVIVILDEISWIGSKDTDFLGKLKNAWDLQLALNPELVLIVCGSVSSWIERNILSHTGFVGRVSIDMHLQELPIQDCAKFWNSQKAHVSSNEIFKVLSVTGGVPKYLEEIIPSESAEENIKRICFKKDGILFNEFNKIFNDLFSKENEKYRKIVHRLAEGKASLDDIYKTLEVQPSGACKDYMEDLIQAGFVARDYTWNLKTNEPSNLSYFRLSDNYLRFYLKMIEPQNKQIRQDLFTKRGITTLPNWSNILGHQFENLVLNNIPCLIEKLGIPLDEIQNVGPFFQKKNKAQRGCQIDLLIQTSYQCLYVCEVKFSKHPITAGVIEEVKTKIKNLTTPKSFSIKPVLIHVNGVNDHVSDSTFFAKIIDFSDFLTCT